MNSVAITVCASAWVTLKQIDSVARALTISPSAQKRLKIAAIVGFRLAEIAILTATVLWATGSKMVADDVERCQLSVSRDIFADDLVDEEPLEYGEDVIDEWEPALCGFEVERIIPDEVHPMDALDAVDGDEFQEMIDDAMEQATSLVGRSAAKAMTPEARLTIQVDDHPALEGLSIRELKALASDAKIKRYSNLTKEELIKRLRKAA